MTDNVKMPEPAFYMDEYGNREPKLLQWMIDESDSARVGWTPYYTADQLRAAVLEEREAWATSLRPLITQRMGAEQVREGVQAAIRARSQS